MSIDYLSIDILNFRHRLRNVCGCMIHERLNHNKNFRFNRLKLVGVLFDSIEILSGLDQFIELEESLYRKQIVKVKEQEDKFIINFKNGLKFSGNISNHKLNGYGELFIDNQLYYQGEFKDNLFHGKGKLYSMYCDRYEGDFKDGCVTGFGTVKWCNGSSYRGMFIDNLINGAGIYKYSDGSIYHGTFYKGYRFGIGRFDSKKENGETLEITSDDWAFDFISGKGNISCKEKSFYYKGDIGTYTLNNLPVVYFLPNGNGVLFNEDEEELYVGQFKFGLKCGNGNEYHDNGFKKYSGTFLDNKYEGFGKLFDTNGQVIYSGCFQNNKKHGEGIVYNDNEKVYTNFKNDLKFGKCHYKDCNSELIENYFYGEKIVSQKFKEFKRVLKENKCSICQCEYKENDLITKLSHCDHVYHSECIFTWLQNNETCPMCRTDKLFEESESKKRRINEL